jgi:hypothetical protein
MLLILLLLFYIQKIELLFRPEGKSNTLEKRMIPELNAAATVAINAKLNNQMALVIDVNCCKKQRIESLADFFRICLTDPGILLFYNSPRFRATAKKKIDEFWGDEDIRNNDILMDLMDEVLEVVYAVERGEEVQF